MCGAATPSYTRIHVVLLSEKQGQLCDNVGLQPIRFSQLPVSCVRPVDTTQPNLASAR